jgi:hypothetical protein
MWMNNWILYNEGVTIGTKTSLGDEILMDEIHSDGARLTIKRNDKYISVSCIINKWIEHTRFFNTIHDAKREYRTMKPALVEITDLLKTPDINQLKVWEAISNFVRRFP